jgi:hypothetical protein
VSTRKQGPTLSKAKSVWAMFACLQTSVKLVQRNRTECGAKITCMWSLMAIQQDLLVFWQALKVCLLALQGDVGAVVSDVDSSSRLIGIWRPHTHHNLHSLCSAVVSLLSL